MTHAGDTTCEIFPGVYIVDYPWNLTGILQDSTKSRTSVPKVSVRDLFVKFRLIQTCLLMYTESESKM